MSTEYARSVFLLSEVELGWLVSLQLCTSMLAQGIAADLVNASPTRRVLVAACGVNAAALLLLGLVPRNFAGLVLCHLPLLFAQFATSLAITTRVSAAVAPAEIGTALGVEMA